MEIIERKEGVNGRIKQTTNSLRAEGETMKHYVFTDRYGYHKELSDQDVAAANGDTDEMLRHCENLAPEASLEFAKGRIAEWDEDPTDRILVWNCETAMDIGGMRCQCGEHE